jgi:hypothetical protein
LSVAEHCRSAGVSLNRKRLWGASVTP